MNSFERLSRRLLGNSVDRPPNFDIMMRYAAHHIGKPLSQYYLDYRVLCIANLAVMKDFKLDIVQAISDPYREAADIGLEVEFPEDGLPINHIPLLTDLTGLEKLQTPDPGSGRRMSDRLEAIRCLKKEVGGEVPVMGWVEGALAEAADLRGVTNLLTDLYDRPDWVLELLEFCAQVEISFAQAQVEAGADIIGLGDALCSQISPRLYRQFGLPYEQRIFSAVHEMGAFTRLHICGNSSRLLIDMAQSKADILDLDWMVNFNQAALMFKDGPAICGNFDPVTVMLQGTTAQVEVAVTHCMRVGGARSISAAGCEIPDQTPPENLLAQVRALEEYT